MSIIRQAYHKLLLMPGVPFWFRFARRNCATVFMLHRFADRDRGVPGLDPALLRSGLNYLRRNNYEFISLSDLFNRLAGNGPELRDAVVFTIDDGYIDQAEIAGPVFAEFDCPVTTFLTTGFLDGAAWGWWDKIEYIFTNTARRSLVVQLGEESVPYEWSREEDRCSLMINFVQRCKVVADDEKHKAIASLAAHAEVDVPVKPPARYASMTWDDARACEKNGMTFGPHTVTHPVLSRTTDEQASWEINESWRRLCAEVQHPVPVFCYPNGQLSDAGPREFDILRKAGLLGAVIGERGIAEVDSFRQDRDEPYKIGRIPFPDTLSDLIQSVSGIERCKLMPRRGLV